jgi:acyl carrier protein
MAFGQESLLKYIEDELFIDVKDIGPETPLFSSGIIDSFSLVALMKFIETSGSIRIGVSDVHLGNFDSISRIEAYVEQQRES